MESHLIEALEKSLRDNVQRLDEKIGFVQELSDEKIDHLRSEVQGNDKRYGERFAAQESATKYAQEKANEFRGQLQDQAERFITRTETLARAQSNADKIDALQARIDRTEGRSGGLNAGWVILVGAVGLVAALIAIFFALRR